MSAIMDNNPGYSTVVEPDDDDVILSDVLGIIIESRWLVIAVALSIFFAGTVPYGGAALPSFVWRKRN